MNIFKLVTYGRLSDEFFKWVQNEYSTIKVSHATTSKELDQMLQNSNVYAGFYELDALDVSHLKWIHSFSAGVDSFLTNKSITDNSIPISKTTGQLGKRIGEYCLAYVLDHYKKIEQFKASARDKEWMQRSTRNLYESNLLILGTGNMGSCIADYFKGLIESITGINMSGNENSHFDHIIRIDEPFDKYDIIINTLPKTRQTDEQLNQSFFSDFDNSLFINVGRGSAVVAKDLIESINQGHLSAAILDVFENEPLNKASPLWNHPKITVTPHISGITTIGDVISSFSEAYYQIVNNTSGASFMDYTKGY